MLLTLSLGIEIFMSLVKAFRIFVLCTHMSALPYYMNIHSTRTKHMNSVCHFMLHKLISNGMAHVSPCKWSCTVHRYLCEFITRCSSFFSPFRAATPSNPFANTFRKCMIWTMEMQRVTEWILGLYDWFRVHQPLKYRVFWPIVGNSKVIWVVQQLNLLFLLS